MIRYCCSGNPHCNSNQYYDEIGGKPVASLYMSYKKLLIRTQVSSWIHPWSLLVVVTSVIEDLAIIPLKQTWSMRIYKAPSAVVVSSDAPDVTAVINVIDALLAGYNIKSRGFLPRTVTVQPRSCFSAIISRGRISVQRAFSGIVAKRARVVVFVFGTALFASSQLISITVTLFMLSPSPWFCYHGPDHRALDFISDESRQCFNHAQNRTVSRRSCRVSQGDSQIRRDPD